MIRTIRQEIATGVLTESDYWPARRLAIDHVPFADLPLDGGWPDVFLYYFRCMHCGSLFSLSAETYHGIGGEWAATTEEREEAD